MRCGKAKKWFSASLDARLDPPRESALRTHLSSCPRCAAFASELASCERALDAWTAPELAGSLTPAIMARIPRNETRRSSPKPWLGRFRFAPVGLAAAAFGFGVLVSLQMASTEATVVAGVEENAQTLAADEFEPLPEESAGSRLLALFSTDEAEAER